jgi:hypothetical protein
MSRPQGHELHLDVSTLRSHLLYLDLSTPQWPEMHLDLFGQHKYVLLLDLSAQQEPLLLLNVYTKVAELQLDVSKLQMHLLHLDEHSSI